MNCSFDVDKLAAGDGNEWGEMVEFFNPILRHIINRNSSRPEESEDLLQELWAELWTKRTRLKSVEFIGAYLSTATRYKVCSRLRPNKKEQVILDTEAIEQIDGSFSRDETWKIFFDDFLESMLTFSAHLTTRQKEMFHLILSEPDISAVEMGRRMKCTKANVFRHRKTLRNRINCTFDYKEIKHEFRNC